MGLIDASRPRPFVPRRSLLDPTPPPTPSSMTWEEWMAREPSWRAANQQLKPTQTYGDDDLANYFNPDRGGRQDSGNMPQPRDSSYGAMSQRDFEKAAEIRANNSSGIGPFSPSTIAGLFSGIPGGSFLAGILDRSSFKGEQNKRSAEFIGKGQMSPDEAMAASLAGQDWVGGGVNTNDLGASLAERNTTGVFAKGGKVGRRGLLDIDPPGPDNVVIGAKTGERVLNEKQYGSLSKEAKAEVDKAMAGAKKGKPGHYDEGGKVSKVRSWANQLDPNILDPGSRGNVGGVSAFGPGGSLDARFFEKWRYPDDHDRSRPEGRVQGADLSGTAALDKFGLLLGGGYQEQDGSRRMSPYAALKFYPFGLGSTNFGADIKKDFNQYEGWRLPSSTRVNASLNTQITEDVWAALNVMSDKDRRKALSVIFGGKIGDGNWELSGERSWGHGERPDTSGMVRVKLPL